MLCPNILTTTVFLDFSCGLGSSVSELLPFTYSSTNDETVQYQNNASYPSHPMHEKPQVNCDGEYLNIAISFYKSDTCRLGKILHNKKEPLLETAKLLARLKTRYCLRIAILSDLASFEKKHQVQYPSIYKLVDYFIAPNALSKSYLMVRTIEFDNFFSTKAKLASFGLWDF